jgi:hypothetical protein
LGDYPVGASHDGVHAVDRPVQPALYVARWQRAARSGVADPHGGLADGRSGDPGQFAGDPARRGLGVVAVRLPAQPLSATVSPTLVGV